MAFPQKMKAKSAAKFDSYPDSKKDAPAPKGKGAPQPTLKKPGFAKTLGKQLAGAY